MPRLARLDAYRALHRVMGRGALRKVGELRSGGRRRAVVKARRTMSWIGVRELGYSGADVARYLGVTNSCVTRMISSGKKEDIDDNLNLEL
ncbi:MAG: hypothetical protein H8D96_09625 [Desulfobacterales bacterium]|uniref:Uncharacterized protein n=1 Tax=Candidatus Desulfatibia vada TaxID=2841696 RepID=A0A8J6TKJ0_9BACT|nr:hypothetical protein [Candidatus Desulfatibia vada]MBL6970852.1 hypothetical protein [Desulfobacterales bacterium]